MAFSGAGKALKSSNLISWKSAGRLQRTVGGHVEVTGTGLHSGKLSTVRIKPELAGKGRRFDVVHANCSIPATVEYARESALCTTLSKGGVRVRTVEHLLSALEGVGVDNCRIEVVSSDAGDRDFEVPILDGSASKWVEEIESVGLVEAVDEEGNACERLAPYLEEHVQVWKKDSFVAAFPSPNIRITYGIEFPQVENMRNAGLIKGGSMDNAIVCSTNKGWLNPPLRFDDEPCRHKVLDLIGDLSLFARFGNQGLPVAHIIAFKSVELKSRVAGWMNLLPRCFEALEGGKNMHKVKILHARSRRRDWFER